MRLDKKVKSDNREGRQSALNLLRSRYEHFSARLAQLHASHDGVQNGTAAAAAVPPPSSGSHIVAAAATEPSMESPLACLCNSIRWWTT